jgi:hypothetical protein
MSDITNKARQVLVAASAGLHALEAIGDSAKGMLSQSINSNDIAEWLHAVVAAVDAVRNGLNGGASPKDIEAAMASLRVDIVKNDREADGSIDAKFPTGHD